MCLQYCHVQQWVLDNDVPCATCERAPTLTQIPPSPDPSVSCLTCRHVQIVVRIRYKACQAPDPAYIVSEPFQIDSCDVYRAQNDTFHIIRCVPPRVPSSPLPSLNLSLRVAATHALDSGHIIPTPTMQSEHDRMVSWTFLPTEWGWCSLTSWTIPPTHTCCHHNATIVQTSIHRNSVPLAPWHHASTPDDIDRWLAFRGWDATQPTRQSDTDFAHPRYYGIPSTTWDLLTSGMPPTIEVVYEQLMRIVHGQRVDPSLVPLLQALHEELPHLRNLIAMILRRCSPNPDTSGSRPS
jgi:hypothetical protein